MTDVATCGCGKPTRDGAFICEGCLDDLAGIFGSIPTWVAELETDLIGERSPKLESGSRSTALPLPFDTRASDLLHRLRSECVTLVRLCDEEAVRHQSPTPGLPADTVPAMATWLLWRSDGLAWVPWAWEALSTWKRLQGGIERFLAPKQPQQYLGVCTNLIDGEACGGGIYAEANSAVGECNLPDCRKTYAAETQRRDLEAQLDSRLCTAAEIARLSTYLGLDVPREQVRKKVHYWSRHGRIVSLVGEKETGDPMYLYGEVKALLYQEFARKGA